eukprot:scaffold5926_cov65-Phaeocystis_antarctica.AAC.7
MIAPSARHVSCPHRRARLAAQAWRCACSGREMWLPPCRDAAGVPINTPCAASKGVPPLKVLAQVRANKSCTPAGEGINKSPLQGCSAFSVHHSTLTS